jgi:hypothetical protein
MLAAAIVLALAVGAGVTMRARKRGAA